MEGKRKLTQVVTLCVQVNGRLKYMKVKLGGQEKIAEFRNKIKKAFGLSDTASLDIDFTVENPFTGETMTLNGMNTYCAAIHCGALTDKERESQSKKRNLGKEEEELHENETQLEVLCTDRYERMQQQRRARLLLQAERREMDLEQSLDEVLDSVQIEADDEADDSDDEEVQYHSSNHSSNSSSTFVSHFCGLSLCGRRKRRRREGR
jgi:hypothetical protein